MNQTSLRPIQCFTGSSVTVKPEALLPIIKKKRESFKVTLEKARQSVYTQAREALLAPRYSFFGLFPEDSICETKMDAEFIISNAGAGYFDDEAHSIPETREITSLETIGRTVNGMLDQFEKVATSSTESITIPMAEYLFLITTPAIEEP
jgi:hypothetical protein